MVTLPFKADRARTEAHLRNTGAGLLKRAADTIQRAAEQGDLECVMPVRNVLDDERGALGEALRQGGFDHSFGPRHGDLWISWSKPVNRGEG